MPAHRHRASVDVVQHLHPIHDFGSDLGRGIIGNRLFPPSLPFQQVLLEFVVRKLGPVLNEPLPLLLFRKRGLRPIPFDLGDADFFVRDVHQEIEGVQHAQLDGHLFMLFDVVVGEFLGAVADSFGRPIGAVGEIVANTFPPGNPFKEPEENGLRCPRGSLRNPCR